MEIREQIAEILERAKVDIQVNLEVQGVNASGRTSESLKVEVYADGVRLLSDGSGAPIQTTEVGRRAGAIPYDFTSIIEQWSRYKGLHFDTDKERRAFASAVAWGKIRTRGYGRPAPSDHGSVSRTIYTPVVDKYITDIRQALKNGILGDVTTILKKG